MVSIDWICLENTTSTLLWFKHDPNEYRLFKLQRSLEIHQRDILEGNMKTNSDLFYFEK